MLLQTPRLRVRHFVLEDAAEIFRLSQEEGMRSFLPDQVYADEDEARGVLEFLIERYSEPDSVRAGIYVRAVELLGCGELIGHVGLSPSGDEREVGYAIAEAHQGLGYATELVEGTTRRALEDEGSLVGIVASDNLASIRVLEKAGFELADERERQLHGARRMVRTYRAEIPSPNG